MQWISQIPSFRVPKKLAHDETRKGRQRRNGTLYVAYKLFRVNKLECELCKTEWPKEVLANGAFEGLLSFQNDFSDNFIVDSAPYIVFQTDTLDEDDL